MARLLVIEDDPVDRRPLRAALEHDGHSIVLVRTREETTRGLLSGGIELVVLCTAQPDPSVAPLVAEIKRSGGDQFLPVVLVGSSPDAAALQPGERYGADDALANPEDPAELVTRVRALLVRRSAWAEVVREREVANERERLREELTTLIVHDLKNPLAAILANLDFALEEIPRYDAALFEALVDSKAAARRMLRLLANMLDVARMESNRLKLQPRPVELRTLLGSVVKIRSSQALSRAIVLDVALDADLSVVADEDILTRVVENILDNALRYTPRGGRIRFTGLPLADRVRLRIGNNGPPIPPALRAAMFDKYTQGGQSKQLNLGLGMYFCRLAAEAHGGRIWIEEEADYPTVFVVDLGACAPASRN